MCPLCNSTKLLISHPKKRDKKKRERIRINTTTLSTWSLNLLIKGQNLSRVL